MMFYFDRKQQTLKSGPILVICLLLFFHSSSAQHNQSLPDSLNVGDSLSFTEENEDKSNHTIVDTTVTRYSTNVEDSIFLRSVPDSVTTAFQKSRDFAYANDPEYWIERPVTHKKDSFDSIIEFLKTPLFRGFVLVLLAFILLYALYKIIVENNLYMFYSSAKEKKPISADESDLPLENLEDKIHDAVNANDFRTAVRYMHLKLLRLAGDRGLIRFHAQGTNEEYINQLATHPQAGLFRFLTKAYEYTWYGGFDLRPEQFDSLQKKFKDFYSVINH